ncbi:MAG: DUF1573 domain-containing protein [Oligoflexus sp.]
MTRQANLSMNFFRPLAFFTAFMFPVGSQLGLALPVTDEPEAEEAMIGLDEAGLELISQPPGRIQFENTVIDLGKVYRGQNLNVSFPFVNNGKGPLRIQGAHTSCGCTVVSLPADRIIEAGAQGEIEVLIDTNDYLGEFSRSIAVLTSDAKQSSHILTLKAQILTEIHVEPPIVDFGGVIGELGSHRTIRLEPAKDGEAFSIERIEHHPDIIDIAIRDDGRAKLIDVYLKPGIPSSFVRESLVVVNNSKHLARLPIPLRADILGRIRYAPNYVEFGAIPSRGVKEKTINLSSQQDFQIQGHRAEILVNGQVVQDFRPFLEFQDQLPEAGRRRAVAVRLKNPDKLKGTVHGRLIFATSNPAQEELAINFYAFFQE